MRRSLAFALAAGMLMSAGAMTAQACSDMGSSNCGADQNWRRGYDDAPVYGVYYGPPVYGTNRYEDDAGPYAYSDSDYVYNRDADISNYGGGR
jgi:hypothetical protein